jgi:hypothetical protein
MADALTDEELVGDLQRYLTILQGRHRRLRRDPAQLLPALFATPDEGLNR